MKQNAIRLLKALWIRACRFDGIDHNSKFVIFSEENPFIIKRDKLAKLIHAGSSYTIDGFSKKSI